MDKLTTVDSTANALKSLNDEYNNHKAEFNKFYELQKSIVDKIDKQLIEFLGNPPVTTPNIAEIKASMLEIATFQLRYEEHVKQFSTFRKNIVDKFLGGPLDKLDIKLADIKKSIEEIPVIYRQLEAINMDITTFKNNLPLLEKIKIPHERNIINMVYTVFSGSLDWEPNKNTITLTVSKP
ncbi:hypothetical protein CHS0354_037085, partial [Potamilus streckersoni]